MYHHRYTGGINVLQRVVNGGATRTRRHFRTIYTLVLHISLLRLHRRQISRIGNVALLVRTLNMARPTDRTRHRIAPTTTILRIRARQIRRALQWLLTTIRHGLPNAIAREQITRALSRRHHVNIRIYAFQRQRH